VPFHQRIASSPAPNTAELLGELIAQGRLDAVSSPASTPPLTIFADALTAR
jgi:hypothetical protein